MIEETTMTLHYILVIDHLSDEEDEPMIEGSDEFSDLEMYESDDDV